MKVCLTPQEIEVLHLITKYYGIHEKQKIVLQSNETPSKKRILTIIPTSIPHTSIHILNNELVIFQTDSADFEIFDIDDFIKYLKKYLKRVNEEERI